MKKLIIILILLLTACDEFFPSDGTFICKYVESGNQKIYNYQFISIKGHNAFWVKDTANKYTVGDTIYLTKIPFR